MKSEPNIRVFSLPFFFLMQAEFEFLQSELQDRPLLGRYWEILGTQLVLLQTKGEHEKQKTRGSYNAKAEFRVTEGMAEALHAMEQS